MAARVFALLALVASASATVTLYNAYLDGLQQNPPVTTNAFGWGGVWYDDVSGNINCTAFFAGITSGISNAHIHGPAVIGSDQSPPPFQFTSGQDFIATTVGVATNPSTVGPRVFSMTQSGTNYATNFATQKMYYNLHSATNTQGEIRGELYAQTHRFAADLSPGQQNPPITNTMAHGRGWATIVPPTAGTPPVITYSAYMWGLSGPVTSAHIHRAFRGTNGGIFKDISTQVMGDMYYSWVPPTQLTLSVDEYMWFISGQMYFNFHTALNTGGELRGQLYMAQSPAMTAGSYSLEAAVPAGGTYPCKQRGTGSDIYYEDITFNYMSNGMIWMTQGWFADSECKVWVAAAAMNATLINAGVNQFLQRDTNNLDRFLIYPWDVTYATASSDLVTAFAGCNACAGATLTKYNHFTVHRSCGAANVPSCQLLGPRYFNGRVIDASHVSFTDDQDTAAAAWDANGVANTDVSYSAFQSGAVTDFLAAFPKSGASAVVPSMFVVVLAALVALLH